MSDDPSSWSAERHSRTGQLLMLLKGRDSTIDEISGDLDVSVPTARTVIHDLRTVLGQVDDINVVVDRDADSKYRYRLVGHYDQALPWFQTRLADAKTRLGTIESVALSIVRGTPATTREHREAQIIEMGLRHVRERIEAL